MGISTKRYLPPNGTAGLQRTRVSGSSRVPRPPPIIMQTTFDGRHIGEFSFFSVTECARTAPRDEAVPNGDGRKPSI